MDATVVVGVVVGVAGLGMSGLTYRLGQRSQGILEAQHHEERRPRITARGYRLNGPAGPPHVELVHKHGPRLAELVLTVLPPLAGTRAAGHLMETGRAAPLDTIVLPGPMQVGDQRAVRVTLAQTDRGPDLRLRITARADRPRPWWHPGRPAREEWDTDVVTVTYDLPGAVHSPVGVRLPPRRLD